jgi:DNA-binding transcriptional ArsR family regulator
VKTNAARCFVALADPTRRQLFERLARRPMPVGRLADGVAVSRPAVSQHLKVLEDAGLVVHRREGTRRVYQLAPRGADAIRAYLDRMWDRALASFQAVVEGEEEEQK